MNTITNKRCNTLLVDIVKAKATIKQMLEELNKLGPFYLVYCRTGRACGGCITENEYNMGIFRSEAAADEFIQKLNDRFPDHKNTMQRRVDLYTKESALFREDEESLPLIPAIDPPFEASFVRYSRIIGYPLMRGE